MLRQKTNSGRADCNDKIDPMPGELVVKKSCHSINLRCLGKSLSIEVFIVNFDVLGNPRLQHVADGIVEGRQAGASTFIAVKNHDLSNIVRKSGAQRHNAEEYQDEGPEAESSSVQRSRLTHRHLNLVLFEIAD
jgi:hypothetical protein